MLHRVQTRGPVVRGYVVPHIVKISGLGELDDWPQDRRHPGWAVLVLAAVHEKVQQVARLNDAEPGYLLNFFMYRGKDEHRPPGMSATLWGAS